MSYKPQFANFYLTEEEACPYLPDRNRRLVYTPIPEKGADPLYHALTYQGFRRSGKFLYSNNCQACKSCIPVRIPTRKFIPSRGQKRIMRKNANLVRSVEMTGADLKIYNLCKDYLDHRHPGGEMGLMDSDEFANMVGPHGVRTVMVKYRIEPDDETTDDDRLVAVCLTDIISDGLSMCYSFFDPEMSRYSPGIYMILDHVDLALGMDLDYVYLGYWIEKCPKMSYKSGFENLEYNKAGRWYDFAGFGQST